MPTEDIVARLDFTQGLDTRTDERIVVHGKLLKAQNVTLSKDNAITKVDGFKTIETPADDQSRGLAVLGNELLLVDSRGDTWSVGTTGALFSRYATVSPFCALKKDRVRRNIGYQAETDAATISPAIGQVTCYVWRDYAADQTTINGILCTVIDETTGAVLMDAQVVTGTATAFGPRVIGIPAAVGGASDQACFIILWGDGVNVRARVIDLSTVAPSFGTAATTVQADMVGGGYMDAATDYGNALVLYQSTDGTNSLWALHVVYSGGALVTNTKLAIATQAGWPVGTMAAVGLGAFGSAGKWGALALQVTGAANAGMSSATLATGAASINVAGAMARKDATAAPPGFGARVTGAASGNNLAIYSDQISNWNTAGQVPIRTTTINDTNVIQSGPVTFINSNCQFAGGPTANPRGPFIAAKAFTENGLSYLPVFVGSVLAGGTNEQPTLFVLREGTSAGSPVISAVALQSLFGLWSIANAIPTSATPPSVSTLASGELSIPSAERGLLSFAAVGSPSPSVVNITSVGLSRLRLLPSRPALGFPLIRAQLGAVAFMSGGVLTEYDGHSVHESGFLVYPEGLLLTRVVGGGVMTGGGSYQVVALYEWLDGQGQRHQSAPSPAVTITSLVAADRLDVTVPTLLMTMKPPAAVNVVIYCTGSTGTTLYRVNAQSSPVANTPTAAEVTYRINATDATIQAGEILYTTGGILPNITPPPCSALTVHQSRLFMIGLEDPNAVEFSQAQVTGFGLQFNDTLTGILPTDARGAVGVVSIDDKLVIFATRRPYVVSGQGPNSTGLGSGYSLPDEVASDVGCAEPRSILKTPMGIVFKSSQGWHLLERGLSVRYIGAGVESFNANDVRAAALVEDRKEARFYSSSGVQLYWSYLVDQWSTRLMTALGRTVSDAVWWPAVGAMVFLDNTPALRQDLAPGIYGDAGAILPATIDTGWLRVAEALAGFQRAKRLLLTGGFISQSSLTIRQYIDFDSTVAGTVTIPDTTVLRTGAAGNAWAMRWHLPQQKCTAMRFEILDTPLAGGGGLNFSSLSLLLGKKRGAAKLPAARSV